MQLEVGQAIIVRHEKPWRTGRPIQMRGWVSFFDGVLLVVDREFRNPGRLYDGLHARQEPGDYGSIELRRDSWVARRRYFRRDGTLIGELYNIQTPTEFLPGMARYLDLEIDVAYIPGRVEEVEIQDTHDLDQVVAAGFVPRDVAETARSIAGELAQRLKHRSEETRWHWDFCPLDPQLEASVEDFLQSWLKRPARRSREAAAP